MKATISLDDETTKNLLTEILVDMIHNKREVFYDIMLEALEDVGLTHAIIEGRQDDYVSEHEIFSILNNT